MSIQEVKEDKQLLDVFKFRIASKKETEGP
jgi:hypothetical protein